MNSKIDNFNKSFIKAQTQKLTKENKIQDKKLEKTENIEVSKLFEQSELVKSYPSLIKERKISNDSISICGSQAETLSQTSESSFFLSFTNQNKSSQLNSSKEIIQIEKKLQKNIPFYHGLEEYFHKLMPEKFSEYKNSKNFLPKNSYYKKHDYNEYSNSKSKNNNKAKIKNKEKRQSQNQNQNMLQFANCFYLPCFGIYCPINAFYFNNFSTVIINNNNKINNKKENNEKVNQKVKKEESSEDKDKKLLNEKEEIEIDQDKEQEQKSFINSNKKHCNYPNHTYIQKYNYKRNLNQEYNHNSQKFINLKYNNQNYYNKKYNKFSDYYNENDFQQERNSYYNNNYYKRRHHNIYENRFYKY